MYIEIIALALVTALAVTLGKVLWWLICGDDDFDDFDDYGW